MNAPHIVVIGSVNSDLMLRCPRLPAPGETVTGSDFLVVPGGKGANQAVAAARLGARVSFIGCVGDDAFGRSARAVLDGEGVDTRHLATVPELPTGVAMVIVDDRGENAIALAAGANAALSAERLDAAEAVIATAALVVCQLESPLGAVEHAAQIAQRSGVPFLLNPAPACTLPDKLLRRVAYLVPNESEATTLSGLRVDGVESAHVAAAVLHAHGAQTVIITLGARGAVALGTGGQGAWPAVPVKPLDTTGAGDTFVGAFAVARAGGQPLADCIAFAQRAAAWSVQRRGAQASMPHTADLQEPTR
jgi:ribokinase